MLDAFSWRALLMKYPLTTTRRRQLKLYSLQYLCHPPGISNKIDMSSSSAFTHQFKSYCTTLEQTTKQLRLHVEGKGDHAAGMHCIDGLLQRAETLSARVAAAEEAILGPLETRLSTITIEEVYQMHYLLLFSIIFRSPFRLLYAARIFMKQMKCYWML